MVDGGGLDRVRRILPLRVPRPRKKYERFNPYIDPHARGRKGGLHNRGKRHPRRRTLVSRLREIMGPYHPGKTPPLYSEIVREIKRACPWSRFGYDHFMKIYLPRWRNGTL